MDRAPVGHHEIGIAPVCLQHLIEEPVVFARVASVHLVVGAHHAPGRPRSMAISKASRSDSRIAAGSIRASRTTRSVSCALRAKCLVVEMMWRLCTPSIMAPAISAGEQRVLGEIFEIAAAARVANEIRRAAKKDIEAFRARFGADCLALKPREAEVPGRGEGEIGRHRRRCIAAADVAGVGDAKLCVRFLQRRNAEARYPGHIARRADRSGRFGLAAPRRRDDAMEKRQLLLLRHLLERHLRALSGRQRGIVPRPVPGDRGKGQGTGKTMSAAALSEAFLARWSSRLMQSRYSLFGRSASAKRGHAQELRVKGKGGPRSNRSRRGRFR